MLLLVILPGLMVGVCARHHREIRSSVSAASVAAAASSTPIPISSPIPNATTSPNSSTTATGAESCFPFSGTLPSDLSAPPVSRSDWWCAQDNLYGFLGFSYPLEVADCSDDTNSYESINADLAKMKKDFGASMIRVYAPECREASVWENLLQAGVSNNMGIIVQVWWGFDSVGYACCAIPFQEPTLMYLYTESRSLEEDPILDLQRHDKSEI